MKIENEMVHLSLKTGFSFKETYGDVVNIFDFANNGVVGVADTNGTFAFPFVEKMIKSEKDKELKCIYGIRVSVVRNGSEKVKPRGQFGAEYILISKNETGIKEIYNISKINYDNFYYRGQVSLSDIDKLSENVFVISEDPMSTDRLDYIALTNRTPRYAIKSSIENEIPLVIIDNNWYSKEDDHKVYELLVGPRFSERQTYPQHIMTAQEHFDFHVYKNNASEELILEAIENTIVISEKCESYLLPRAPMVKSKSKKSLEYVCKLGAKKRGINITDGGVYAQRYEREMKLINEKGFQDYFLVVQDMISKAKKKMLVGPGRGSAAGSLVCYLTGITEGIDPVKYGLLFERFIDVTRSDLPDIDIDFPDTKRKSVIKQLIKDYGEDHVKHIANVSRMQPKSAINEFAKGLRIPISDSEEMKDAIIETSGGDARANFSMQDTFGGTDTGKAFIEKYPNMRLAGEVENHPSHSSVHAGGIIVCNDPIHHYCGTNSRDNTAMVDKKTSEDLNLLKIDVLGLRTLSVLEDCARMLGWDPTDYYDLELEDQKTFDLISMGRTEGVFQFEGHSLKTLAEKMEIENFNDMTAITSLARPGALYSGGAGRYVKYRNGEETPVFYGDLHEKITGSTYGIVVYQEQILDMCRKIGEMSWEDVNALRRALSKSMGKEFFLRYKNKFYEGAKRNGYTEQDCEFLWGEIEHGGNYAFNKSHADSYALISYWTAYMKANHIKEFVVANLRNAKDEDSAIKILRDSVENEGIEYMAIDPDESEIEWSINSKGVIVGGLTSIKGIGVQKARGIMKMRSGEEKWTPGISKKLLNPETAFDILWPVNHYFGDIYENPNKYGLNVSPQLIKDVKGKGEYVFIGKLRSKNIRDLNEYVNVAKRDGEVYETHTKEFSMKLEDDTDSVMIGIGRFDYERLEAQALAESGIVDEDYYMVKGKIYGEGRYIKAEIIMKLNKFEYGISPQEK